MSSDVSRGAPSERIPRNYWTILAAIRAAGPGEHLTAQDVHARARTLAPTLGFATVHRALTRLHELGYVLKVDVPGAGSAVYEPAGSAHAHFRCSRCGAIRDIDFTVPGNQLEQLAAQLGLRIDAEATTFAGHCADCLAGSAGG